MSGKRLEESQRVGRKERISPFPEPCLARRVLVPGLWKLCKSCLRGSAGNSSTSRAEKGAGKPGLPVLFDVGFFQSPFLNVTQLCDPSAPATGLLSAWAPAGRGGLRPLLLPLPTARYRVLLSAFTCGGSCPGKYRMRSPCCGIEWAAVGSLGRPRWWQGTGWWHGVR